MPGTVVVGLQWGDEGKGKVVDVLAENADFVVRFAGGANAGHTLVVEGRRLVFHLLPSGLLRAKTTCLLGAGMVLCPETLVEEMERAQELGIDLAGRLVISARAHVVTEYHKVIDGLREQNEGAIGTTLRGIGPAYEDRASRRGLQIGALGSQKTVEFALRGMYERALREGASRSELVEPDELATRYRDYAERLQPYLGDVSSLVHRGLVEGRQVLFEGAQGTLLDLGFGSYPYVTSSQTLSAAACTGVGVGPGAVSSVVGVLKVYTTRVGLGPFPTEASGAEVERLRRRGAEFGATTGRPRRCGWLDLPALRYAVRVNGVTELFLTKLDVLSGLEQIPVAVGYRVEGRLVQEVPCAPVDLDQVEPMYESLPGWADFPDDPRSFRDLPEAAVEYVRRIERETGVPVRFVSVGPDRRQVVAVSPQ